MLKARKGHGAVPEILGSDRLLLKCGVCAAGRHCHFPAGGCRAAGRFCEAEQKLLLPSFSFCWLVAVSGGVPVFVPQGCRAEELQLDRSIHPMVLPWGLSHEPEVLVECSIPRGGIWFCCLEVSQNLQGIWRGEGMLT